MKKIDMKKTLDERVRNTEWTDANTRNVLRKIRNAEAARREYSPRRLMPAAVALLLVFGIGIAALTGKPGGPDPIRDKDKYTAQPIVTALSVGQGEGTGDLLVGNTSDEDSLQPVNLSCEKQGICVNVVAGLATGNESSVQYTIQDLDNKYPGLEMEPDRIINTICPEDGAADGSRNVNEITTCDVNADEAYRNKYIIGDHHSRKIQGEDREITLGIRDMRIVQRAAIDLHPYIQEYAKPQEGKITKFDGEGLKILDTAEKLSIPLGRDDVLLTGIGWIDNQLHVRIEYTGEGLSKNGKWYDQACDVWISGDYIDPAAHEGFGVDYTMLTGSGKAGVATNQYEEILDCGPDNYDEVSLILNYSVLVDVVQDDWTVNLPLSTICPEIEPAEKTAAETDDEWQNAIKGRVHDFLTCWQQKELDGMLAMCTEPWRSEQSLLRQILDNRIPESWQVTDIKGEGWPVVTVGCEIRMQSEADVGFYLVKMKKEADGLWYFEPAGLGEGNSVYSVWFNMKDEDVILSSNETGSTVKAGEIPAFVSRINEFYTCWSKGDKEGMLALCPPDMRDTGYENFMIYLQSLPGTPLEWKIGQLYGKPEDDVRGAACEGIHRSPNGSKVMNLADIVVKKESDGQWYIIPASIDEIANSYAKTADGIAPLPEDEWHTTLSGRLDEFLTCWQKKDKDGLLALCTTPWRSEWDKLNQLLENRTPKNWEIKWVKESGLPVVTVGCSISMQSEDEDGFFRFTAKKETDGLWYFEPHKMWDTKITVDPPYSITDKDLILTGNEKGSQAKAEEIPPFVNRITDFLTLWNKGNTKGMLALCQPSMRNDKRHVAIVEFMVKDGYKPIEWKIGQLYGAPEEDARGAACELTIRHRDGQEILYPVDITETKEADGQWYISCMSIEQIMSDMLQAEQKAAEEEELRRNDSVSEEVFDRANLFYNCWMDRDKEGMLALCMPVKEGSAFGSLADNVLEFGTPKALLSEEILGTGNTNTRKVHMEVEIRTPGGNIIPYDVHFTMKKAGDGLWYVGVDETDFNIMSITRTESVPDTVEEVRESREEPDIDSILMELRPVGSASEQPDWVILQVVAGLVKDGECWLEYSLQAAEGKQAGFDYSTKWFAYLYTGDFQKQFMLESIQDPICLEMDAGTGAATYLGRYKCYYPYEDVKLEDLYLSTGVSDLKISKTYHTDLKPILQEYGKTKEGMISRDHAVHVGVPEEIKVLDTGSPMNIPLGTKDAVLTGIGWIDGQLHIQIKDEGSKKARDENDAFHSPSFDLQIIARDMDTGKIVNVETEYSPVVWLDSDYCKDRYEVILNCGPEELDRLSLEACISSPFQNAHGDYGHIYLSATIPMSMISDHEIPVYYGDFYDDMMANSVKVSMELGKNKLSGPEAIDVKIGVTNVSGRKLEEFVTLYDPDGKIIEEFGRNGLDVGETREWSGQWTVTEEQLKDETITFYVEYSDYIDREESLTKFKLSVSRFITKEEAPAQEAVPSPAPAARSGRPVRVEMELGKDKLSGPETIDVTIKLTNVSGDTLTGPVILYDPDGNQVAEYSEADFAAGETKEWTGKWTVTEAQLAEGKIGFSVKYSDYREGTTELMAHKLTFSQSVTRE